MFEVNNGVANINGSNGKYENNTVKDSSIRYGKNAVENLYSYMEQPIANDKMIPAPILDFSLNPNAAENNIEKLSRFTKENDEYLKALPPLEFEYRYMPQGKIDKKALLGAAYAEMGQNKELAVKDLDAAFAQDASFTAKALDINNDGKIDVAEYSTSILAADMLSKDGEPNPAKIDGTINSKGFDAVYAYAQKSNAAAAAKLYTNLYNHFDLENAKKDFQAE